jgi:hypothetical protein
VCQQLVSTEGPDAVCEGKEAKFLIQAERFPSITAKVRLSFVTTGAGRATFKGGSTVMTLFYTDLILGSAEVTVVGGTPSSSLNDISLKAEIIEMTNPPPPIRKVFTVADSIITKDVAVVTWINGDAITLPTAGVSQQLIDELNSPNFRCLLLFDWYTGNPRHLLDQNGNTIEPNRRYANAWLLKNSANQPPPGTLDDAFINNTVKYTRLGRLLPKARRERIIEGQ